MCIVLVSGALALGCNKSDGDSPQLDDRAQAAAKSLVAATTSLTAHVCGDCQACSGQACRDCLDTHADGTLDALKAAAAALGNNKTLRSHKDLMLPDSEQKAFVAAVERGNLCVQKINDRAPWGIGSADAAPPTLDAN
jgi:hypothetical protein